jgi:uncharacterized membrane protein
MVTKMDKTKIRKIAYGGILTGLVLVATMFLQIPNGIGGNVNLGDGIIFASALILGPFAGVVGALGSMLADLFAGYAQYAPATFIIKGLMGLIAGFLLKYGKQDKYFFTAFIFFLSEIIMVGGYFVFEAIVFKIPYAVSSILPNIIQAIAGIAIGLAFIPIVKKIFDSENPSI